MYHEIWLRIQLPAEADKLVRAEAVRVQLMPGKVGAGRTLCYRTDSISPSIAGGKIAAGVAYHRQSKAPQSRHYISPKSLFIGKRRIRLVNTSIDTPSEMFNEAAENIAVNIAQNTLRVNFNLIHDLPPALLKPF
jgi:hypothetical protein